MFEDKGVNEQNHKDSAALNSDVQKAISRIKLMNIDPNDLTSDQVLAFINYNNTPYGASIVSRICIFLSIPVFIVSIYNLIFGSNLIFVMLLGLFIILTIISFVSQFVYFKNKVISDINKRKSGQQ